jgi:hypothetical protein
MARYLSLHSLACLTRQGAEQLVERMVSAPAVHVSRVEVNLVEGKMFAEFDAADRKDLEAWFASAGFHYDWLMRVELTLQDGKLAAAP